MWFIIAVVFVVAACSGQRSQLNKETGTLVGDGGLAVGVYRIVGDSSHDVAGGPGAQVELSRERRLEISRQAGDGDDLTWCSWWVSASEDPEGIWAVASAYVANDDQFVYLTSAEIGLTLRGDCVITPE